jgi:hypothetical protein
MTRGPNNYQFLINIIIIYMERVVGNATANTTTAHKNGATAGGGVAVVVVALLHFC